MLGRVVVRSTEQDHARLAAPSDGEELTEIGVDGDQTATGVSGGPHDSDVGSAEQVYTLQVNRVMPCRREVLGDLGRQRLVDE